MQVNILGTEYNISVKKYEEDRLFEDTGFGGYCDSEMREIVVCDFNTHPAFIGFSQEACDRVQRKSMGTRWTIWSSCVCRTRSRKIRS